MPTASHPSSPSWLQLEAAVKVNHQLAQLQRALLTPTASVASDDDSTIKVAPKKVIKDKPAGQIKLKKPAPKHNKPGDWKNGSIIDGALDAIVREQC